MLDRNAFDNLAQNVTKYEIHLKNYQIPARDDAEIRANDDELVMYEEPDVRIPQPQISIWVYLKKSEIEELLRLNKARHIRIFIEVFLKKTLPKGFSRLLFRELIYTVVKFCKKSKYNVEQTGAVLSQFYLTHRYFTSSLDIGAEKLYNYFKNLQMNHSLPFPPDSTQLFDLNEVKTIMLYFCKIYLRNLPLIRTLTLPNFALCSCHTLEPDMKPPKKKKGKDKSAKKSKKK